ncbi:hypothetical protein BVI434_2850006 [Burkholderia vietnamiensis]|nr:hypothetical protein BVI434_2850006 [Burkholderia vietnamiensis]
MAQEVFSKYLHKGVALREAGA